jgi:hypothetical protein
MKNTILLLALLCASLGLTAQETREVTFDTAYVSWTVTETDTAWFFTRQINYADGSNTLDNTRTADTSATRTYLINQNLDDQRRYADAIAVIVRHTRFQAYNTLISNMLMTVTGANYGQNIGLLFGDQLIGSYTVQVTGQQSFVADMVRLNSGSMRLRRQDNPATEYQVTLWSDRSFRVSNLPGASGNRDLAFTGFNSVGKKTYRDVTRTITLQRRN